MQYFILCQSQRSHPQLYTQFSCREGSGRRFENSQNGFSDCLRNCLSTVHWLPCLTRVAQSCDDLFNLLKKYRQIWAHETHFWCRDTIVLDIWWYMLVMRERRHQCRIIWMWKVVIPIQSLVMSIH